MTTEDATQKRLAGEQRYDVEVEAKRQMICLKTES